MLKKKYFFILFFIISCSTISLTEKSDKQYNIPNDNKLSFIKCNIFKELENNKNAKIKFKGKRLDIFVNENEEWVGDISKKDWMIENNEIIDNIKTNFRKKKKLINFTLEKFHTKDKTKLESKDELVINLQTKSLFFNKLYYNFNQEIFFESTLYGKCNF